MVVELVSCCRWEIGIGRWEIGIGRHYYKHVSEDYHHSQASSSCSVVFFHSVILIRILL